MARKIDVVKIVRPGSVGLGGPFYALGCGFSGFCKKIPFWAICPLWCILFVPLSLLFPPFLPIYFLYFLQKRYRFEKLQSEQFLRHAKLNKKTQRQEEARQQASEDDDAKVEEQSEFLSQTSIVEYSDSIEISVNQRQQQEQTAEQKASVAQSMQGEQGLNAARVAKANYEQRERNYQKELQRLKTSKEDEVASFSEGEIVRNYLCHLSLKRNLIKNKHLIILACIAYYICIVLTMYGIDASVASALKEYEIIAKQKHVLQIATPEQMAFSNQVLLTYTIAAIVMISALIITFLTTIVATCDYRDKKHVLLSTLIKNLPSIILVYAIAYGVIMTMERYYSHFKVVALEAIIKGMPYFDPSISFILLRFYVINAFLIAFVLMFFFALNILEPIYRTKDKRLMR